MNRPPITVTSDTPALDTSRADQQLAALASLLARSTGSARVVPLDFAPLEPVRGAEGAK